MPSQHFVMRCLALVLCFSTISAVPQHAVRRQDNDNKSIASLSMAAISAVTSRPMATTIRSARASATVESSSKPSISATDDVNQVPATASTFIPEPTHTVVPDSTNPLPIQPRVTPAMGMTGALLLVTGLIYTVIGIKNKWIHVSGSAAYLTALAVTVLIIYLMNPPVSNSVQGAFFVAAFLTGVIFGILALVFADITEGFGCLLGGFCLSMWFLSLKEGGLISSNAGRAVFISCMSAFGYSLSFSHYTRNYGLIASISFSGATVTMLGIDCLSCAGWKEFWLYLWALNGDVFPLNTNTYPLTKNIRAELAGVVIIAVCGVVSQLRVWNLVKERRAKSAAQELEQQQEKDREEEARGRNVEDNFRKERAEWEAAYGSSSSIPDSSFGSSTVGSHKGSSSIKEREIYGTDNVEMLNLYKTGVATDGSMIPRTLDKTNKLLPDRPKVAYLAGSQRRSRHSTVPPPPAVVPLPFTAQEGALSEDDDNASVSAMPDSPAEHRQMSKRVSDMSTMKLPSNRMSRVMSDCSEALERLLHINDDRDSSVAATLDNDHDDVSVRQLSPPQSPVGTEHEIGLPTATHVSGDLGVAATVQKNAADAIKDTTDTTATRDTAPTRPTIRHSLRSSTDPKPDAAVDKWSSRRESRSRVDTLVHSSSANEQASQSTSSISGAPSDAPATERAESHVGSLKDGALPARLSKVALSYRTNEWAKHLEAAERPDPDELPVPASPRTTPEDFVEEKAVPVSDELAGPLVESQRHSRRMSSASKMNRTSGLGLKRSSSRFSQELQGDQRSLAPSSAIASPGVLSRSNSGHELNARAPLPGNTLMGQRDALMRRRTSSQSKTSASNLMEQADQEEVSLAQRRQLLQHHQVASAGLQHQTSTASHLKPPPSASQKWQKKSWAAKGAPAGFDSHQPRRTTSSQSDQKREELYAGWRNKMQDVTTPQTQAHLVEQQRVALLNERRQKEVEKQQREAVLQQRASRLDSMMRSGHMLDAHREAMRKMQANANRNAP